MSITHIFSITYGEIKHSG